MRKILACSVLLTLLTSTGCWDRKEVNDLAIVMATAIDQLDNDRVELSIQIFIPRSTGGAQELSSSGKSQSGSKSTMVHSASGTTVADAMSHLQAKLSRRLFWGHAEVFVFGEARARKGISDDMDYFQRSSEQREGAELFIGKGKAKDLLTLFPSLERSSAEVLRELSTLSRISTKTTMKDAAEMLVGDQQSIIIPFAEVLPPEAGMQSNQTVPYISGSSILRKDQLVGYADDYVTRGIMWVRDEIKEGIVAVENEDGQGEVVLSVMRSKTELIPSIKNGTWSVEITIQTEHKIVQNTTSISMLNPHHVKKVEKMLNESIEKRVELALNKVQKQLKVDVFGFASAFHRKYPQEWKKVKKNWNERFPNIEVKVSSQAMIKRPGFSNKASILPPDEVEK